MPIYTVQAGDCLSSLAKKFGLPSWKTIYYHDRNTEYRRLRPNPNVIYPHDRLYIPTRELKEVDGATEQRHRFRLHGERTLLRLVLKDSQGQLMANRAYTLTIDSHDTTEGVTSAEGMLEELIRADANSGVLLVAISEAIPNVRIQWKLHMGWLDPVDKPEGIQARLNNLGYLCGAVDGIIGPLTKAAVRRFQEDNNLIVDGNPGPQTQRKLEELHGS